MKLSLSLTIILPAYNEEQGIKETVISLVTFLNENDLDWQLIIINDGSTDKTGEIIDQLSYSKDKIKVIHHKHNRGIGSCFRDGVLNADKEIITWIPADGENSPGELIKYFSLLEHVDIVIPFVLNVGVRSLERRILSIVYLWVINLSFGTMFNYTNGNVIYKRKVFDVVKIESNGFFFQTECLIKSIRAGFIFAEVPVRLRKRNFGGSKALTIKSFIILIKEFVKLFINIHVFRTAGRVYEDEREVN